MNLEMIDASYPQVNALDFEVVERKGIGHPDTLCDAIAERASSYYSQYCLEKFNAIAHHWFDKVMLLGGDAQIRFGFGQLSRPLKVIFAGKAALTVGSETIPVQELLTRAARDVLCETLEGLSPDQIEVQLELTHSIGPGQAKGRYNPTSATELFDLKKSVAVSNDCNVCSGFAPLSPIENLVLEMERYLSSQEFRSPHQDTGFDIKIVGTRLRNQAKITINLPFLASKIPSREVYLERVKSIESDLRHRFKPSDGLNLEIEINPEKNSGRSYLTVTGTVADTGDVGVVGRGNRLNGLITPMRPMSIEAACGKNPCDHTGKLYGILAQDLADQIYKELAIPSEVHLVTFKERPVTEPSDAVIYLHQKTNEKEKARIREIYQQKFSQLPELRTDLIEGRRCLW